MDAPQATAADAGPRASPRQVAAVVCGNALEFYDFLTYAFFAASIGHAFFPGEQSRSLLASLATFGVGFVMRPVGAAVLGRFGDRRGRKPAMLLSFGLMGLGMVGLALTPGYASIGVAAPALAVIWRLVQGFALGGEVGPTTAFLAEAAPPGRRGVYVSFQLVGQRAAALGAGLIGLGLSHGLSAPDLDAWGWRVAFLAGAVIIPFGLILRGGLVETLAGPEKAEAGVFEGRALIALALLSVVVMIGGTVTSYITDYLTTYATQTLGMGASVGFAAPVASGVTGVLVAPLAGWLSDRIGRKPVMLGSWALVLVGAIPMFLLLDHSRSLLPLVILSAGLSTCMVSAITGLLSSLGEGLPMRIRSGALGLAYATAVAVFGGTTQYMVAWLTKLTHSPLAPAWYLTAAVGVSFLAMLAMPETAPAAAGRRAQRQTSDARIAA
jgi:MFS family permease